MAEHLHEWLNAYLDGELSGWRRERVEKHLADCPACRAELDALHRLSQVVQQVPLPQELPSAERFAAQVMLRLPRKQTQPVQRSMREMGWWMVPATLLVAWAFVQAVFWLNTGIWTAGQAGFLGEAVAWLAPKAQAGGILTGAFQWLGLMPGDSMQQIAGFSESIGWNLLTQSALKGGLALLYLGWLTVWWLHRQQSGTGLTPAINQNNNR
jgi:predicted anti-sigma-YlaC factor YlaD